MCQNIRFTILYFGRKAEKKQNKVSVTKTWNGYKLQESNSVEEYCTYPKIFNLGSNNVNNDNKVYSV